MSPAVRLPGSGKICIIGNNVILEGNRDVISRIIPDGFTRGAACLLPIYPTIPHTSYHQGSIRNDAGDHVTVSLENDIVPDNAVPEPGKRTAGDIIPENGAELRAYRGFLDLQDAACCPRRCMIGKPAAFTYDGVNDPGM